MENFIPDPKHIEEWQNWYNIYNNENDDISQYRARCILGLITGQTMDFN